MAGRADVHPDQRRAIYSINAATGGETVFDQLMLLHESSESPEVKRTAILTLGATRDAALLQRALEFVIDSVCFFILSYSLEQRHLLTGQSALAGHRLRVCRHCKHSRRPELYLARFQAGGLCLFVYDSAFM